MRRAGSIRRLKGSEYTLNRLRPQLAGRYVAFRRLGELNEFSSASGLVVLDMRTGAIHYETARDGSYVSAFVVKRNGSVAYIAFLRLSSDRRQVLWTRDGERQSAPID